MKKLILALVSVIYLISLCCGCDVGVFFKGGKVATIDSGKVAVTSTQVPPVSKSDDNKEVNIKKKNNEIVKRENNTNSGGMNNEINSKSDVTSSVSNNAGAANAKTQISNTSGISSTPIIDKTINDFDSNFDISKFDNLDNTLQYWGLKLNKMHKLPEIGAKAENILKKYGAIYTGDTTKKQIYLTFDEGYENGYTPLILNVLKNNGVKSIFFVTGAYVNSNPQLIKRMIAEGHQIGNHTINHPSLPKCSSSTLVKELYVFGQKFYSQFGVRFFYVRPPMGEYSEKALEAVRQFGYKAVFWSFAYKDYDTENQKGAAYAHKMVMDNLHNGAIILLHAVSKDNAEALDGLIKDIRAEGYEIMPFEGL